MKVFTIQRGIVEGYLDAIRPSYPDHTIILNEPVDLHQDNLPALIFYTTDCQPDQVSGADRSSLHQRSFSLKCRIYIKEQGLEEVADDLYTSLLSACESNRLVSLVGNPSLDTMYGDTEAIFVAELTIPIYYRSTRN
jgi:hypothetical protein